MVSKRPRAEDTSPEVGKSHALRHELVKSRSEHVSVIYSDLLVLDHAVNAMQRALHNLLRRHSYCAYTNSQDKDINIMLNSHRVQLALQIKEQFESAHNSTSWDTLIDLYNDTATKDEIPSDYMASSMDALRSLRPLISQRSQNADSVPYEPGNTWPPQLPGITDRVLRARVFTHKSVSKNNMMVTEEVHRSHNERLEFLGDAILNQIVTVMLFDRFPEAEEGKLTLMRSKIVCNETLNSWCREYKLDSELKTNLEHFDSDVRQKSKLVADLFEAYIAGIFLDSAQGIHTIQKWLEVLVEPLMKQFGGKSKDLPLNFNAKNELYALVGSALMQPRYEVIECGDSLHPFTVVCRMGDEIVGKGTARNKKEAGLRAAMSALENRNVVGHFEKLRRETPRAAPAPYQ